MVYIAMSMLTDEAKKLVAGFSRSFTEDTSGEKYKVSQSLGRIAFYYERIRNAVEYREEHAELRAAIERIIRRLLWENPTRVGNTGLLAESLVRELVWARYLKNNSVLKTDIKIIAGVLSRYFYFLSLCEDETKIGRLTLREWALSVLSGEIEEILLPMVALDDILAEEVSVWFDKRFTWTDKQIPAAFQKAHVWAAIYRSLFKCDLSCVRYHLLKKFYPIWFRQSRDGILKSKKEILLIVNRIETIINSPEQAKLLRLVRKQTPPFLILAEIIKSSPNVATLEDREGLVKKIKVTAEKRYREIGQKIGRGILRSFIYILATKMLFALLLEVPYEMMVYKSINFVSVLINICLPPLLMILLGVMIRKPGAENTKKIEEKIFDFIYDGQTSAVPFSVYHQKKKGFLYDFFALLYLVLFLALFGGVFWGLRSLHFSLVSTGIFYIFLSLVLLFGFRVKSSASELNVMGTDEGFVEGALSIVFLPFLNLGNFLSSQFARFNVLIMILDFLIEAPLKNILGVINEWNVFIKEKKDDIIESPVG